jgi:hypothetical protein
MGPTSLQGLLAGLGILGVQHLTVCPDATCFIAHFWVVPTPHHDPDDLNGQRFPQDLNYRYP